MPATQTDYNNTGDRDSYSCPSNALSPCPALKETEKAEKEYEEVWKNKPHFLGMNLKFPFRMHSKLESLFQTLTLCTKVQLTN